MLLSILLAAGLIAVFVITLTTSCTGAATVRLSEAWSCWFSGREVKDLRLTGLLIPDGFSILFWGRLGKVLSFFSGLYVVAEIVGYPKIVSYLARLPEQVPRPITERYYSLTRRYSPRSSILFIITAFGSMFAMVFIVIPRTSAWEESILGSAAVAQWVSVLMFIVSVLVMFIISGVAVRLLFRGILRLIEENFLWTKILALSVLTLGFHFDLLAS